MKETEDSSDFGKKRKRETNAVPGNSRKRLHVQIITGSYERALHGLVATVTIGYDKQEKEVTEPSQFRDNFLFNAHTAAVRCLAVSPASSSKTHQQSKRILASGGADERINLYSLSTAAPSTPHIPPTSSLLPPTNGSVDPSNTNREIGNIFQHSSTVTRLAFPSHSKLLSASLDNTIAITRVRDWSVLSTVRAPLPKAIGRPSGDTATTGDIPRGINDFAVHPSGKLCLSIGVGERCMRLWNLMTGKKAGVLNFDKKALSLVGGGRWKAGEARAVVWSADGEEFALAFEGGCLIFGLDCKAKAVAVVHLTKVCQISYLPSQQLEKGGQWPGTNVLAVSTEDGRVLFFQTDTERSLADPSLSDPKVAEHRQNGIAAEAKPSSESIIECKCIGELGPRERGTRIKDFEILTIASHETDEIVATVVTGTSTGRVQIWTISSHELDREVPLKGSPSAPKPKRLAIGMDESQDSKQAVKNIGVLRGSHECGERITCLAAFIMDSDEPDAEIAISDGVLRRSKTAKKDIQDPSDGQLHSKVNGD